MTSGMYERSPICVNTAAGTGFALVACGSGARTAGGDPRLNVAASHREVLVGETVTLTAGSRNLIARDAKFEWHTSGDDLRVLQDDRAAHVSFSEPGTYDVGGDLIINGARQQVALQRIAVRPLPR